MSSRDSLGYSANLTTPSRYYDLIVDGTRDTLNPTLTLNEGWRYFFSLGANLANHPIQFGEDDSTAGTDDWKIGSGNAGDASFETDSSISWVESTTGVTFTLTPSLAAELVHYQCQTHEVMLGDITIVSP